MLRMMIDKGHRAKCSQFSLDRGTLFGWKCSWETIDRVLSTAISMRN